MFQKYAAFVIGCARLAFDIFNNVAGVLRISNDPNDRANPREIVYSHLVDLRFSVDADKHDYLSPIVISVSRRLLSDAMHKAISMVPFFQPGSLPPLLDLNNVTEEERILVSEIACGRVDGAPQEQFLSVEEIAARQGRLAQLQSQRELCKLINGNHRLQVCLDRARELYEPLRLEVIELQRRLWVDKDTSVAEELADKAVRLEKIREAQTWQVIVIAGMYMYCIFVT